MGSREADARPAAGEEYNPGPTTPARQAATVMVLRGEDTQLEVLLVQAAPPAAAVRELPEGAGILRESPAELVKFSRWITPAEVKVRFDTHFFLTPLPPGQQPQVDGEECVDLGWFTPAQALAAHEREE